MSDVVVTVPKGQWADWIAEGVLPGDEDTGIVSHFWVPNLPEGLNVGLSRVYVVAHGRLRGYAILFGTEKSCVLRPERACLMRRWGATAVTIDEPVKGFQGFRYRWWSRSEEEPFPDWQTRDVE